MNNEFNWGCLPIIGVVVLFWSGVYYVATQELQWASIFHKLNPITISVARGLIIPTHRNFYNLELNRAADPNEQ